MCHLNTFTKAIVVLGKYTLQINFSKLFNTSSDTEMLLPKLASDS